MAHLVFLVFGIVFATVVILVIMPYFLAFLGTVYFAIAGASILSIKTLWIIQLFVLGFLYSVFANLLFR